MKRRNFIQGLFAAAGVAAITPVTAMAGIGNIKPEESFISTTGSMEVGDIFTIEGISESFVVKSIHDDGATIKHISG